MSPVVERNELQQFVEQSLGLPLPMFGHSLCSDELDGRKVAVGAEVSGNVGDWYVCR